jgi:hypothetical protein
MSEPRIGWPSATGLGLCKFVDASPTSCFGYDALDAAVGQFSR